MPQSIFNSRYLMSLALFKKKSVYSGNSTIIDFDSLATTASSQAESYQCASPFPHIVLDDFIDPEPLNMILQAFPAPDQKLNWRRIEANIDGDHVQHNKLGMPYEEKLDPLIRQLFWEMNSGMFLRFLEALTGIHGLLPDPGLQGAGLHQSLPGAILGVHADFTEHKVYHLTRRLNLLLYLNKDWKDEYEGHLELWSSDMAVCKRRVRPLLGRCVIFNTDADSFHGSPVPLACPEGMTRKSIALYYYTNGRNDKVVPPTAATDWRKSSRDSLPALE